MDLTEYSLEDLLLAAIKSEIESRNVYASLEAKVKNAFLKDRLNFLANEETKHQMFIEHLFEKTFPGRKIVIPAETPVPIPWLHIPDETVPLSHVIAKAMEAEKDAHEFYEGLADRFDDADIKGMLHYFADMELNHYRILDAEQENMKRFEDFDVEWPMMNVGA